MSTKMETPKKYKTIPLIEGYGGSREQKSSLPLYGEINPTGKLEDQLEIPLNPSPTPGKTPFWKRFEQINIPKSSIGTFFPGLRVDFVLQTNCGIIVTSIRGGRTGDEIGSQKGVYIKKDMGKWWDHNHNLEAGSILRFTRIGYSPSGMNLYKLEVFQLPSTP